MQATASLQQDELTALIANIKGNSQSELEEAECVSQVLYSRSVDELDFMRAKEIWHTVRIERAERYDRAHHTPGTCWQCGINTGSDSTECRPCHEGFGVQEFNRTYRNSF
jgi:heterodisulfide reductase subunit C